jgi:hypothetical protein
VRKPKYVVENIEIDNQGQVRMLTSSQSQPNNKKGNNSGNASDRSASYSGCSGGSVTVVDGLSHGWDKHHVVVMQ